MLPVQVVVDRNRRGLALVVDLYGLPFLDGDRVVRSMLRVVVLRREPEVQEMILLRVRLILRARGRNVKRISDIAFEGPARQLRQVIQEV